VVAELTRNLPFSKGKVRVGPGDDCAVIGRARDERWTLLKTDAVVEGVHFSKDEDLRRVGWKALCRTISDFAAMGGVPEHALVTVAARAEMEFARLKDFYAGLRKAARRFEVGIVGGETSRSLDSFFCSIAMTGWVERKRCVTRSGGIAGDAVYVTGRLGGSFLSGRHLDFLPRLAEARWLVTEFRLHAMMDLSDGLGADLPRLAKASGCGFEIWEDRLPLSAGCTSAQALAHGEDFELLFTLPARVSSRLEAAWRERFPRLPLTQIGVLIPRAKIRKNQPNPVNRGFDHFA